MPALIIASQDENTAVRVKSVYALGQVGDPQAIDALIVALGDPVQDVSWTAREALETFGETALPNLIRALSLDSNQVRELAANLLGDIGDSSAVDPLIAALDDHDWQVRFAVVEALGSIGDAHARSAVERMTGDPQSQVRAIANAVLKMLA